MHLKWKMKAQSDCMFRTETELILDFQKHVKKMRNWLVFSPSNFYIMHIAKIAKKDIENLISCDCLYLTNQVVNPRIIPFSRRSTPYRRIKNYLHTEKSVQETSLFFIFLTLRRCSQSRRSVTGPLRGPNYIFNLKSRIPNE